MIHTTNTQERTNSMSTTERDEAPWTWTGDRFANHYGSGDWAPERMEHDAALDWSQNGNPQNGDRLGEFFIKDGQMWNDGKYCARDGSHEPYFCEWVPLSAASEDGKAR